MPKRPEGNAHLVYGPTGLNPYSVTLMLAGQPAYSSPDPVWASSPTEAVAKLKRAIPGEQYAFIRGSIVKLASLVGAE